MTLKKNDPNSNPNDMGGPSFHPDIDLVDRKKKTPLNGVFDKEVSGKDGAILDEDQVPPL